MIAAPLLDALPLWALFLATMATVLALPRDAEAFSTVLVFTAAVVIGLSYVGLVVFPNEAIVIAQLGKGPPLLRASHWLSHVELDCHSAPRRSSSRSS